MPQFLSEAQRSCNKQPLVLWHTDARAAAVVTCTSPSNTSPHSDKPPTCKTNPSHKSARWQLYDFTDGNQTNGVITSMIRRMAPNYVGTDCSKCCCRNRGWKGGRTACNAVRFMYIAPTFCTHTSNYINIAGGVAISRREKYEHILWLPVQKRIWAIGHV